MKNLLFTIVFACVALVSYGQELVETKTLYTEEQEKEELDEIKRNQPQTLFGSDNSFGGYAAFSFGYKDYNGNAAFVSGGRLMFVANHYLGIGFGGKGIVSNTETIPYAENGSNHNRYTYNYGGYGGLYLEPVLMSMKPIHVTFPILLGAGAIGESTWDDDYNDIISYGDYGTGVSSVFFVAEPGVDIEFNIAKWFRISLGASYTFTSDIEGIPNMDTNAMNGFNYNMTFKMGWF